MAEITTGNRRVAKPDMTPMVDLGFLLISFFMFTTTFSLPYVIGLTMPKKGGTSDISEENTLTLILAKDNRIFWHQSALNKLNVELLRETSFSPSEIRKLLIESRLNAKKPENFTVIIKPTDESNYKNTVDALDEMLITKTEHYALVDITPKELELLKGR
ncbi:MAG: ExbD/TolR family protein [Spirosomataceae bacterium]